MADDILNHAAVSYAVLWEGWEKNQLWHINFTWVRLQGNCESAQKERAPKNINTDILNTMNVGKLAFFLFLNKVNLNLGYFH